MALWAISDLHLAINSDKPMDIFGDKWENHDEKIKENWLRKSFSRGYCINCRGYFMVNEYF